MATRRMPRPREMGVRTEVTFDRGDLRVCPLGVSIGAQEYITSNWRGVPQGSRQGEAEERSEDCQQCNEGDGKTTVGTPRTVMMTAGPSPNRYNACPSPVFRVGLMRAPPTAH